MSLIMFKKYQGKMFCFSPPVMLATFLIEFSFAAYTYWRYELSTVRRLTITMLIALGTFQLAEYMICGGLGLTNIDWARIGYGSITLLPALGIHTIVALAGKKKPILVNAAYASCVAFIGFYLIGSGAVMGRTCAANYAVFSTFPGSSNLFAAYYYGWLAIGTYLALKWSNELPKRRKALQAMAFGYMAFILPTVAFNIIDPASRSAIPSVMCGFAVIYAFALVSKVMPNSGNTVRASLSDIRERFQIGF